MFKNFKVGEHLAAQFRAEIFNNFNFVNYSEPANNASGSNLGQVGSTYDVSFGAPEIGRALPATCSWR